MVLDDVLTGLDVATERSILDAVFGPDGVLKQMQSTVIFSTNSGNVLGSIRAYKHANASK